MSEIYYITVICRVSIKISYNRAFLGITLLDTSLNIIVANPHDTTRQLNDDLQKHHQLASQWLVAFNTTKEYIFSFLENSIIHISLLFFMNNQSINEVHTHKHLGIFLSSDCQWHDQVTANGMII